MTRGNVKCPRCGGLEVTRHLTPLSPEGEADVWVPAREESYRCAACTLIESCLSNAGQSYLDFRNRWNDSIEAVSIEERRGFIERLDRTEQEEARAWTWPHEYAAGDDEAPTDRSTRATKLSATRRFSDYMIHARRERGEVLPENKYGFPVGAEYVSAVLSRPDEDAPRLAYAQWLRTYETEQARAAADFIDWQLRIAASFRANPHADIKAQLPAKLFSDRQQDRTYLPDQLWWRSPGHITGAGLGESTNVLAKEGLIDDEQFYRGFVEHVAIKASRFLEIAEELYSLAPIRQLTITYCKGIDHRDAGLLRALLESPHLDRIRVLKLPVRKFGWDKGDATTLNALTDADIEMLAASQHLRGLTYLDLEDQKPLTIRAFDALAASSNLPSLSAVRYDINRYDYPGSFSFGTVGKQTRALADRPLAGYAKELENRYGRIPWLHVADHYGTETPDVEAVVENPIT